MRGAVRREIALVEERQRGGKQDVVRAYACCQQREDAEQVDSSRVNRLSWEWKHGNVEMGMRNLAERFEVDVSVGSEVYVFVSCTVEMRSQGCDRSLVDAVKQ